MYTYTLIPYKNYKYIFENTWKNYFKISDLLLLLVTLQKYANIY